jgi:demethylmenaquinone methyltransferase/2-methoxy-6-polyprenyl-1,4-benzoquinol methylase
MLAQATELIASDELSDRIALVRGTGERLPFPDATFDAMTFTYLLRYVSDPAAVVAELARVVKPGGMVSSLEFSVPPKPWWRAAWWCYTRAILPVAGAITGGREWYDVGRFLGPSIANHYRRYSISWTEAAWRDAGLEDVHSKEMSLGGGLVMWGRKAGG